MDEYITSIGDFEVEEEKTPDFVQDTPMISYNLFCFWGRFEQIPWSS